MSTQYGSVGGRIVSGVLAGGITIEQLLGHGRAHIEVRHPPEARLVVVPIGPMTTNSPDWVRTPKHW
jgi:hypothetical protein